MIAALQDADGAGDQNDLAAHFLKALIVPPRQQPGAQAGAGYSGNRCHKKQPVRYRCSNADDRPIVDYAEQVPDGLGQCFIRHDCFTA